jgi:hypothetical protein
MNWKNLVLGGTGLVAFGTGLMELHKLYPGQGGALTVVSVIFCGLAALLMLVAVVQDIRNPPDA